MSNVKYHAIYKHRETSNVYSRNQFSIKIRVDGWYFPWTLLLSENLLNVDDALSLGIYGPSTITSI